MSTRADQNRILEVVRAEIPRGWRLARGPGLDTASALIRLRLSGPIDPGEETLVREKLLVLTGYSLQVEHG